MRQIVRDPQRGLAKLLPVLDCLSNVAQDVLNPFFYRRERLSIGLAIDLQVHPRLVHLAGLAARPLGRAAYLNEVASDGPANEKLRVDDQVDCPSLGGQGASDGIDQKGHVVGHDFDDGVAARPAVFLDRRREDPNSSRSLWPLQSEPAMRKSRAVNVNRVMADQILRCDVPVVAAQEVDVRIVLFAPRASAVLGNVRCS